MSNSKSSINKRQLKEGYKQTEVGVIPEDWEVVAFSELFEFRNGVNADKEAYGKGIPFINVLEIITHTHLYSSNIPGRVSLPKSLIESYAVHYGDILFNRTSETQEEVGLASVYLGDKKVVFGGFVIRGRNRAASIDPIYSGYSFRSSSIRLQIIARGQGAVRANIGQQELSKILAIVPPEEEQRAIARALSDADTLIAALDKQLAKKRHIKTATMQQLLTGKKRLPGFGEGKGYKQTEVGIIPEDWFLLAIADVVEHRRIPSGIYKEKKFYGMGNKIIKIGDVFRLDYFDVNQAQQVQLNSEELVKYRVNLGDIFIALASVKLEGVGKVMLVTHLDEDTAFDHNVALIRSNDITESKFLFYILKSNLVRRQVGQLATQVGTTFLKASTILAFQIPVPAHKAEQQAIAQVLSDIDTEIAALEKRRAKTQAIKQGMMQELLTGRTRLINN